MKNFTSFFLVSLLALPSPLWAARGSSEDDDVVLRPVVSAQGIQRIYDNIEIVANNIKDTQANIISCEKNRAVVIAELQEIDKLEREQAGLIKNYETYLTNAKLQIDKNQEGIDELSKFDKENREKLKAGGKTQMDLATKLSTARQEITTREKWRADAESKTARVQKLLLGAKTNLRDIQSRRSPLKAQLAGWVNRQAEFKKLLKDYGTKKIELERLAELKKKDLPPQNAEP